MKLNFTIVIGVLLMACCSEAMAAPIQWRQNGHYYDVVDVWIDWNGAKVAAEAMTYQGAIGHLATITSLAKSEFLWRTFTIERLDGKLIGGTQKAGSEEPGGGWEWITGEAWLFENWHHDEPNDAFIGENTLEVRRDDHHSN